MRIFVAPAELVAGELTVRGDEHHYLGRVRRARIGDAVEIFDGAGHRARAVIARMSETETTLLVELPEAITAQAPHVRALVPLIKGDRMDTCLEKLVEVGADTIVVWPAARSVIKLERDRRDARRAKFQALVQAAARQCGRALTPSVELAESLAAALAALPAASTRLVLDPSSDAPLASPLAAEVVLASGPEGGLTPEERDALAAAGFVGLGLGPRILRAETAPVIATALVRALTRT